MLTAMAPLIALVILGQALSAERAISPPVVWPAGESAQVTMTSTGLVFSMADKSDRSVLRVIAADGTIGAPVNIGGTSVAPVLATSPQGVVAFYTPRSTSTMVSRLFDATTAQPLAPPRLLGSSGTFSEPALTSWGGHVLWARGRGLPDAGYELLVTPLNPDGTPGLDVDVTAQLPTIHALRSNTQGHWAATRLYHSDGGVGSRLVGLSFEGQVTSSRESDLLVQVLIPTERFVFMTFTTGGPQPGATYLFVAPDGGVVSSGSLGTSCWGTSGTAVGDEVWLGCSSIGPSFRSESLGMIHISLDGGTRESTLVASDGGEFNVAHVVATPVPLLFFERVFREINRGNWRATYVLPLSADGLTAAGVAEPIYLRPSSQSYPSFATREPGVPNALAWNDDRQLPREPLVEVLRVSSSGALGAPNQMEKLYTQFTNPNSYGRLIATDGTAFMFNTWGGFDVTPHEWPFDGGPGLPRAAITPGFGVFGTPQMAPASQAIGAGYIVTWNGLTPVVARQIDSHGVAVGGQVTLSGSGVILDMMAVGSRQLIALGENSDLRLISIDSPGVVVAPFAQVASMDAGILGARMARSGSTLLVAWQAYSPVDGARGLVYARRFDLDGGALDAVPFTTGIVNRPGLRQVTDIGVRQGVFHILGTAAKPDGGSALWVWRIADDGGVVGRGAVELDDVGPLSGVVAGPTIDDGSMLIAYGRHHPDWAGAVQQVFVRSIGEAVATGLACVRNTDCESGFCTFGVCCATEHGCDRSDGGPTNGVAIYQRCGCDVGGGSPTFAWLVMLVVGRQRRGRSAGA